MVPRMTTEIQSTCDMFTVTVNVLSTQNSTMITILPRMYNSPGEGLVMQ